MDRNRTHLWKNVVYISILFIVLPFLFLSGSRVNAQNNFPLSNPSALFYQANTSYEKGDYQKAAELYNDLFKKGYESGNLYFNLANTYYKLGRKGEAVLFYEKAKQLMPMDADLRSNLEFALRGIDEGHPSWKRDWYQAVVSVGSLENLMLLTSLLFFVLAVFLILIIIFPMRSQRQNNGKLKPWCQGTLIGMAAIFIISLSLTVVTGLNDKNSNAVAVLSGGAVRFGPNSQSTVYYGLSEGSRVKILEKKKGWSLIQRRDGKIGWIQNKFIMNI